MRLPAAERRRQLLETAIEVFADQGFHEASMNEVAKAAGVTKPVLYQHFSSKRELYLEVLRDIGGRLQALLTEATATATTPRGQIDAGFAAYFEFVAGHSAAFRVLFGDLTRRDPEFAEEARSVEESVAETIADLIVIEGLTGEHRRLLAQGIVGLAEATCRHWLAQPSKVDPVVLATQASELAWFGLRGIGKH